MLLIMFGLDPSTGKLAIAYDKTMPERPDARADARKRRRHAHQHPHQRRHQHRRRHRLDRFSSEEYAKWRKYNEANQINTGYDESNISHDQKKVLNDAVSTRAGLDCDPLHCNCRKNN